MVEIFVKYRPVAGAAACVYGAIHRDGVRGEWIGEKNELAQVNNAKDERAGADNAPSKMTVVMNRRLSQVL